MARATPVSAADIKANALSIKFNYICAQNKFFIEGILESFTVSVADFKKTKDQKLINDVFDMMLHAKVNEFHIDFIKNMVSDDWYKEFERLNKLTIAWENWVVRYSEQLSENPYIILEYPNKKNTAIKNLIRDVLEAARDSGLSTLLGKEDTFLAIQNAFTDEMPITEDDIERLDV
ncbi:MAG: hypothetical protein AAF204_05560 [Pseudomonadota bacterium]